MLLGQIMHFIQLITLQLLLLLYMVVSCIHTLFDNSNTQNSPNSKFYISVPCGVKALSKLKTYNVNTKEHKMESNRMGQMYDHEVHVYNNHVLLTKYVPLKNIVLSNSFLMLSCFRSNNTRSSWSVCTSSRM